MKRLLSLLCIALLCPALVFAQGRRGGRGGRAVGGGRGAAVQLSERDALDLISILLVMTDMQKQQLTAILDDAQKLAAPISSRRQANEDLLFEAAKAGKSDQDIYALASQQGSLTTEALALQARTFAKLWQILTPKQKSEADSFIYNVLGEFIASVPEPAPSSPPPAPAPATPATPPTPPTPPTPGAGRPG